VAMMQMILVIPIIQESTGVILFSGLFRNNAGIMACPFKLSADKIELQFATNHLGMLRI